MKTIQLRIKEVYKETTAKVRNEAETFYIGTKRPEKKLYHSTSSKIMLKLKLHV